jgi:hypothetical protein
MSEVAPKKNGQNAVVAPYNAAAMTSTRLVTHFALEKFLKPYGLPPKKEGNEDSFGSSLVRLTIATFVRPCLQEKYPFLWLLVSTATMVDLRICSKILTSVMTFIDRHLMCTVTIRDHEYELRDAVMGWASSTDAFLTGTNTHHAITNVYSPDSSDDNEKENPSHLQFIPSYGTRLLWYEGRLLLLSRTKEAAGFGLISIKSFGRQSLIIRQFLHHTRDDYRRRYANRTRTYYPIVENGKLCWKSTSSSPRRPMSTVIFDKVKKEELREDVKKFFLPGMEDWYSRHSIPYRRGYLLQGLPGTGKTSLSYAIASEAELDVYVLSLSNINLIESTIISLFQLLPRRCLILLEDIDAVGISRSITQSQHQINPGPRPISLSTLLNILDGPFAKKGCIICATTNYPERLDAALTRPGRIDKIVTFTNANHDVVAGVFSSIFISRKDDNSVTIEKHSLADQFADEIPENKFTPAEVQGYVFFLLCNFYRDTLRIRQISPSIQRSSYDCGGKG